MIPNRRPLLETLEERILYSADPGPASLAVAVMESSLDLQDGNSCEALTTELVFVDSRSPDYQMLLDDFAAQQAAGRRLEVVMVDASEDGIGLIGRSLEGRSDVSAIHIVGHGEAGSAQLGASRLDSQTLLQRAGEIAAWRDALTADADLLLYGCAVGDGAVGRDLINGLAELTGADVAASDDPTGSAELGGDWQLEVQHGQIEVASLTSDSLQARWRGLLNTYTVTNTADSGAGSLRQAILNANANSGADIINFAISGTQVHTITLNSILPNLTDKVTIDATTDDSFAANGSKPAIILNGNNYTGDGLVITASAGGTTIRGLVIQRFVGDGIQIDSASQGNTIAGNYIGSIGTNGLLSTGTGMVNYAGVRVLGANNVIGGITAADRNVISGNQHGIVISGAGASGNQVVGNYIGTDATGNAKVPNFVDGIHIEAGATGNTVGGSSSAQRNVISGNWQDGVEVADEASDGNIVRGNWIGVAANGSQVLANDGDGVMISGGADNTIVGGSGANDGNWIAGGWKVGVEIDGATTGTLIQNNRIGTDLAGTANWGVWETGVLIENSAGTTSPSNNSVLDNIIAFSGQGGGTYSSGIALADTAGTGNALMRNIIYSSVGLGIDLRADNAVLANDYLDPDTGPNGLQNYPVLFAPTTTGSSIKINGDISTLPSTNYRIEFFASPSADTSGYGEASAYLGSVNVTTNSTGYAIFVTNLAVNVPVGYFVTATATKANADFSAFSDTSEFALSALVQAAVNTAPTITQGATTGMGAIYSEDSPTLGFMVDGVVQVVGWADPDAGAVRGMALTGTTGNGTWQYSTDQLTWRNVGTVSGSNALLLSSTSWLRYVGDGANGETPTIAFRAWDMTTGTASTNSTPSYVTPGAGGGSTAFSTQTANAFTVIDSVNDAPVLVPSAPVLTSITEDQTSNGGQTVASIVGSSVSDVDLGALKGIAVLATANGNGFWEYSTDGTTWNAVGPVSEGSALLLRAEDRIRFVPDGKNGTTASITYRAWDQSSGTPGSKADAGTYGGTSAFSVATDTASLAVTDVNDVPVITSSATASVAENTTAVLTVTATDVDLPAQTLSYSINGGADASKFQINSSTGALSFITAPDFDAPIDVGGNNVYNVTVQVSDGVGGTASQAITVTVTPVNDNLPVITSSATASVAENTTAVLTVTATDADLPAQTLSYSIIGGADASKFQINSSTGALSFITAPDFEAPTDVGGDNVYNVTVQVSDGAGGTASQAITVTVTPVNDNLPVITSSATASVAENTTAVLTVTATDADLPAQTLSYSIIGGADASKFQINSSTGALSFITAPDFDAPTDAGGNNIYNVTVQVSDGAGGTASQAITVTVTPVNDNLPVITSSATASVAENTTAVLTVTATDADLPAQTLSYSIIGGADAAKFQINSSTGVLSFITAPDFEAPTDVGGDNVYNVTVQVSDGAGGTTSQAITVTVTPVNDNLPVITSSATASVAENTTAVLTVTATDADLPAQTLSYSIIGGTDAAKFQIDANTGALSFITAPDFEAPTDVGGDNVYNVTVQVSDGAGGTTSQAITVTVTPVNDNLPVITSSATASVAENTTAVLTVTATDADLPAQTLSYSITGGADAAKFQIDANTGALSFISAPDFEAPTDAGGNNIYNVTVQVSDGAGGTTSQAITVTVTPVNDNLPVITSSATASVAENTTAVLTVTATDADLPAQTLSYSISGGADASKFQINSSTGALSFITAPDFDAPTDVGGNNVYNVTVQVSDGAGGTASQAITVTVTPVNDNLPVITSSATASVAENTTAVLTVTATDADLPAQTLSYSITGGADAAKFQIDANTGALSFISAPDFEAPTDAGGNNVYNVTVQVSDGAGGTASQAITVTVTPVNDNLPVITSSATASVAENTTAVLTVTATDADLPAQTLSYSIIGGTDAAKFQIDANTGALSFITAPDFEAPTDVGSDNIYNVTVQVSDGAGGTASQAIIVTVTPVNDNLPVITSSATASVAENTTAVLTVTATDADLPAQTLSYSIIGGADASKFQIDANTGALSFITAPDFEAPTDVGGDNIYNVTVQVSDGAGGTASQAITVTVTSVNDNLPVITSSATASVAENTTAVLTVTATDADLPAQTLSYSIIGGADASKFQIDANTGALSFISAPDFEAPTDVGGDNVYDVTVQVSDGAGGTTSQAITVTVTPVNDNLPVITSSATASVAENTTAVLTVTATDADLPAQTLSYSIISGADAAKFQIDANTGALSFITAPDFEAPTDAGGDNVYNVTVQVSDGAGGTASQAITVTVTPVNDNLPVITSSATASVAENTMAVLTVTATDADLPSQTLSYSIIGGADASKFQINSSTGALSFIAAPDFEAPTDAGGDNVYNVTVQVSDGAGGTASQAITVTVTPVNDNLPVITSSATASVPENTTAVLTVTATDADLPAQTLSYSISGGADASKFQIDANTGALSFITAPDFEAPTDAGGDNVYNVTVQVSDGAGGTASQAITVTVTPVNDNLPVITSSATASVPENTTAVLTVTATDADLPAQTLSYSITGGADASKFQINSSTGALSFISAPDFEAPTDAGGNNIYNVTVQVSDGAGGTTSQAITVTVTPVNDNLPVITSSATASVAENSTAVLTVTATDADLPAQTLSYSITGGADASKFQINSSTGALSFISAPDFEAPTDAGGNNIYNVTVQVSDGAGGTTSQAITVTVTPVNDNLPVITSSATASVAENSTAVLTVTATDADLPAQTLSYSIIGGADAAKFQIDANTGALSFITAPDFEAPTDVGGNNVYNVTVQVSDGAGGTASQAITVTVTPVNDNLPVITSSATASVAENTTAVLTVTATDADLPSQTLSYSITGGADAAKFQIDANTGALSFITAPDFEAPTDVGGNNVYNVTVQVSDGAGGTASQAITVTVTPVNDNLPVITSSATASVAENSTAVLTVTATDADLPAQPLSYSISGGADAAKFQIDANTGALSFISAPDFEAPTDVGGNNVYNVTVQVSDGAGGTASQAITVTVTPVNDNLPVITSSATASVAENSTAVLTVTATDADLPAQTLSYSITGGADASKFQINSSTGALSFIAAPDFEAPTDVGGDNVYNVTVQVSDGAGGTTSQAITVTVTPVNDNLPVITSSATASVAENSTAVLTVTATDADLPAQTLSYSISGGADASKFQINSSTGALSFITAPDFEAPTDVGGDNVYNVTVQVSDGAGGTASQAITVTVTDVDENPNAPVITSSATASVAENSTAVLTVTATDADLPAQTLSYSIIGGADASKFQINSSTGALSFIAAPDFEAPTDAGGDNVYNVTVQVSDGAGGTASQAITVTVTDVDENPNAPVITSSATASVAENSTAVLTVTATDADLPAQTLSYSISGGADASKFQINSSTGALSFITAPDFEAPTDVGGDNLYDVTVQVSDGAGGTASQAITVTVTPVNDNLPVITSSATASVAENSTAVLTVTATDADLPTQTLTYSIVGGADASKFQINSSTGVLSFITAPDFEAPTDVGGDNVYNVTVQVSDGAGGTASQAITVTVTDVDENPNAPVITSSATASVAENSTAVLTVTATDADLPAQTLSYSITGGADASKFQIDANTGALSFITAPDFEAPTDVGGDNVYNVTVQVSDGAGGTASQAITVTVTPVNDNLPVITSSATASVPENTTAVLTVTATDADLPSQTLSYSITGGADASKFQINSSTGALSFITAPDFEAPTDVGGNNVYNVTVQVSDGAGGTASQAITVTVTPVNDNLPVITSSATASVAENTTAVLTVTATDADLPAQTLSYSISGGTDASKFQIDANTGALSFISAPDFEAPTDVGGDNLYDVTVQVSDGAGGTASQAITVTVTPVNDNLPVITSSATASVAENSTAVLTVTATDADLPTQTLTYSIVGGADAAKFQIDANTGALSFVTAPDFEAPTDARGNNIYDVTVQVSDGAGGSATQGILISVLDVRDNFPPATDPNNGNAPGSNGSGPPIVGEGALPQQPELPQPVPQPSPGDKVPPLAKPKPEGMTEDVLSSTRPSVSTEAREVGGNPLQPAETLARRQLETRTGLYMERTQVVLTIGSVPSEALMEFLLSGEMSDGSGGEGRAARAVIVAGRPPAALDEGGDEETLRRLELVGVASLVVSVGTIWWATRAGGLAASLLVATPAWITFDPLPVLGPQDEDKPDWSTEEGPSDAPDEASVDEMFLDVDYRGARR